MDKGYTHGYYVYSDDDRKCDACARIAKESREEPVPLADMEAVHHPRCRCTIRPIVAAIKHKKFGELNDETLKNSRDSNKMNDRGVFIRANTIQEAESYAKNILGIKNVSYKGCDLESANEWNKGLQDTLSKFPALKSQFNFVGEIHERNKALKPVISDFYMKAFQEHYPHVDKELLKPSVDKKVKAFMKEMAAGKHTMAQSWMPEQEELKDFCGITLNKTFGGDLNVFVKALKEDVESQFHPVGCDTIRSVLGHEVGHQPDGLLGISDIPEVQSLFDSRTKEQLTKALSSYSWDNSNLIDTVK